MKTRPNLFYVFIIMMTATVAFAQEPTTTNHPIGLAPFATQTGTNGRLVIPAGIPITNTSGMMVMAPANDNCANATLLTANAACTAGDLATSTTQSGENTATSGHCGASNFTMSVWYKFTATSATMWVQSYLTGLSGGGGGYYPGRFTSVIYNTSSCQPAAANRISCATMNSQGSGDGIVTNNLTGLTVGNTYLIQIGYNGANGSQDPAFCIRIGDQISVNCNTCAANCGQACGFPSTPTAAQVTAACAPYPYTPYIEGGVSSTRCHSFIASNSTVTFQVIVNTTCGTGNVTAFTWSLYSSGCGAAIQTGTLTNMTFTGLTIGQSYVYCYSYTVPTGCYHTIHYPYFVGAAPLPVELISFMANSRKDLRVDLTWITASETNNRLFELQRSVDGINYQTVHIEAGAGNSKTPIEYKHTDIAPSAGTYYYRLSQTDFDGTKTFSDPIAVNVTSKTQISIQPNPTHNDVLIAINTAAETDVEITVYNLHGKPVTTLQQRTSVGLQQIPFSLSKLPNGIYTIQVASATESYVQRIVKM
jgi:hypothetical protein